jgi:hypothetical protein
MFLERISYSSEGIFGVLRTDTSLEICKTLEHAYPVVYPVQGMIQKFMPKIPIGTYLCRRGVHELPGMNPIETFEVENVGKHTGILFHIGNYNDDSKGCILVGEESDGHMLLKSMGGFARFMENLKGVDSFTLVVK